MNRINEIPKLKSRPPDAHKGTFGKVCIIAGSVGMSGAAALAGRSALRAGSGLVRVAVPESVLGTVAAIEPCYTTIALPQDERGRISEGSAAVISEALEQNDAAAFGPGVGVSEQLGRVLAEMLTAVSIPMVIDGDGLNNLSRLKNWHENTKAPIILTPHPGEMKRLWRGLFGEEPPDNREQCAGEYAKATHSIVVLKGAGTVVTDGEDFYINDSGNPGMATAGSGDVLTGMIVSLSGQGLGPLDAAILGVYAHGLAGDIGAEKLGEISLMATDIIDNIPAAFEKIRKQ